MQPQTHTTHTQQTQHKPTHKHTQMQAVGTKVLARYRGSGGWYGAQVVDSIEEPDSADESDAVEASATGTGTGTGSGSEIRMRRIYSLVFQDGAEEKDARRGIFVKWACVNWLVRWLGGWVVCWLGGWLACWLSRTCLLAVLCCCKCQS